jgi:hypothetical protein
MRNLLVVLFALVLVASVSFAQTTIGQGAIAAEGIFGATVVGGTLEIAVNNSPCDLGAGNFTLVPGETYTLDPISGAVFPDPTGVGGNVVAPLEFTLTGAGAAPMTVQISFILPHYLVGTGGVGTFLPCSFDANAAYVVPTGAWGDPGYPANPNAPFNVDVLAGGTTAIELGITVQVPTNAGDDTYQGTVLCNAAVIGL